MDFMGIGPLELLLVLIIGFLLLGPDKLPGIAAKAGQLYRSFKKATFDLTKTITEDVSTEKKTLGEDVSSEKKAITEDLSSISKTLGEDLSNIRRAITEDLSSENKADKDSAIASVAESDEVSGAENTNKATPPTASHHKVNER